MKSASGISVIFLLCAFISYSCRKNKPVTIDTYNKDSLVAVFDNYLSKGILHTWYPVIIDTADGGYFSNLTFDFKLPENQPKMIVTQSRQIWTSSQAALFCNDTSYLKYARHGVQFLTGKMWDRESGGFYNLRTRTGESPGGPNGDEKKAYGNAFAIYGLSAYYKVTKDPVALDYAKRTFLWLDEHSRDKVNGGYIDAMDREGNWISKNAGNNPGRVLQTAGWKDFNSSIHLLEAFTELYSIWPDPLVKSRLQEMFLLVRDTFTASKGYLVLYFTEDWKSISLRDSTEAVIKRRSGIDHVSFGHDVETGYLLLEASMALGIEKDTTTLRIAKKLIDHSLKNGVGKVSGALYDAGYYFAGNDSISILNKSAEWWVEAEGLNALLMMARIYPENEEYFHSFLRIWKYIETFVIDKENGDWYPRGLYYSPEVKEAPKGSIWKGNYHNGRALMNCINMLRDSSELTRHFSEIKKVQNIK